MADASLRGQLLRLLLFPVAGILAVSSVAAYYLAREPATDAYDGALIDAGIALADRIHVRDGTLAVDLPSAAEQILRTDQFDTIYYLVRDPSGKLIAGDAGIPPPPVAQRPQDGSVFYDATYRDTKVRAAALLAPCGRSEEHTSELQSQSNLVCRLLLEKKKETEQETGVPRC